MHLNLCFQGQVDLPQVDLMNFRIEYIRPQSGRCIACEAAERAIKSQEVDLSRLKGLHLCFAPKMRSGVTCNWSDDSWKLNAPSKQSNVCAFLLLCRKSKLNFFTLY